MGRATRDRALLLAGMMGAGKSSAGRVLATRLGWAFIDTDERVEQRAGRTIPELFRSEGEARFRAVELEVLRELPARRAVIALGGGAVVPEENRVILREKGTLVWLDARPETLAERVEETDDRPLLAGARGDERLELLRALRTQRAAAYARADLRVETDGKSPTEVCEAVLRALGWECAA